MFDARKYQLRHGERTEDLSAKELGVLRLLHRHSGEVLSRHELLEAVWGYRYGGTTRTLDQVVVQLRRKLGDPAEAPRHLLTVHEVGYRLVS